MTTSTNPAGAVPPSSSGPPGGRGPARRGISRGLLAGVLALVVVAAGSVAALHYWAPAKSSPKSGGVLQVVAAENFWGSLVSQMGGVHVSVLSVVSDPNADPHEYESNTSDALAISNAKLVIENGDGYDTWFSQIVAASASPGQVVLNVQDLLGLSLVVNPHFWYGQPYVNATLRAMYGALVGIDPTDTAYFQQRYAALNVSLAPVWATEAYINVHWGGGKTQVASTESIFQYMANSTGLDLVSPYAFMKAVAEGSDPPVDSVTTFQDQLQSGNVSVLVYNAQTVTPLTQQMKTIATLNNVSVIAVTETIQPPTETFQFWMGAELASLENALNQKALGQ